MPRIPIPRSRTPRTFHARHTNCAVRRRARASRGHGPARRSGRLRRRGRAASPEVRQVFSIHAASQADDLVTPRYPAGHAPRRASRRRPARGCQSPETSAPAYDAASQRTMLRWRYRLLPTAEVAPCSDARLAHAPLAPRSAILLTGLSGADRRAGRRRAPRSPKGQARWSKAPRRSARALRKPPRASARRSPKARGGAGTRRPEAGKEPNPRPRR